MMIGSSQRFEHLVAFGDDAQDGTGERAVEALVEHEVAEAVDDQLAVVPLHPLQDVRVVCDHGICAGVDRAAGNGA